MDLREQLARAIRDAKVVNSMDNYAIADAVLAVLEKRQARIDRLAEALSELLNDLEERAKWNLEASQRVVACGNGVYVRAKVALEESK